MPCYNLCMDEQASWDIGLYEVTIPPPVPKPADRPVYVYVLVEPETAAVRYVGVTVNPVARLSLHFIDGKSGHTAGRFKWLRELRDAGKLPRMFVVEVTDDAGAPEAEARWIAHYRNQDCDLLNRNAAPRTRRPKGTR